MGFFSEEFLSWLDQHADEIDKNHVKLEKN